MRVFLLLTSSLVFGNVVVTGDMTLRFFASGGDLSGIGDDSRLTPLRGMLVVSDGREREERMRTHRWSSLSKERFLP